MYAKQIFSPFISFEYQLIEMFKKREKKTLFLVCLSCNFYFTLAYETKPKDCVREYMNVCVVLIKCL